MKSLTKESKVLIFLVNRIEELYTLMYELSPKTEYDTLNYKRMLNEVRYWGNMCKDDLFTAEEKYKLRIKLEYIVISARRKLDEYLELVKSLDLIH